jgi:hypothetical protein
MLCWGLNLIAPAVWHGVHNRGYHRYASTPADLDRPFLRSERCTATRIYTRFFYPGSETRWNPIVYLHFVPYVAKHTLTAMLGRKLALACVAARARFSRVERTRILVELVLVGATQIVTPCAGIE